MNHYVRSTFLVAGAALTLFVLALVALFARHNYTARSPHEEDVVRSFERAVGWMRKNEAAVLNDRNSFLWWMVDEAALLSRNTYLLELTERRRTLALSEKDRNYWDDLLFANSRATPAHVLAHLGTGYKYMYAYALTCEESLLADPKLTRHLNAGFCGPLLKTIVTDPHCLTHQSIGVIFIEMRLCRVGAEEGTSDALLRKIHRHLLLDPRIGDSFIQGLMVLAIKGESRTIRDAWLGTALAAQREDGGWSGADFQFTLGSVDYGITAAYSLDVSELTSTFHTTAQGLLLMAKLASEHNR